VVVLLRVPATDRVLVDERVENGAGGLVRGHGTGLHSSAAVAEMPVLFERVPAARVRLQNARVHREHPGAGHCLEIERPEAVPVAFGHAHAEQAVRPLDSDTADVEHGGQRVEVEVMVLDSLGRVVLVVVHHQAAAEVWKVGERTVARFRVRVRQQAREPRVSVHAHQVLGDDELPDDLVRVQVKDEQLRLAELCAVRDPHVDHPQTVARVHTYPVRVDEMVGGRLTGGRQSVYFVVRVWHQPRRTVII